jgi:8-oxo-dGTP pyrophosphatase MutT (NUDIX family)
MAKPYQVAAIPIKRGPSGALEVLLVTSRETRRWVVPKGWPWRKMKDYDAAAGEAWEEAGVKGTVIQQSVGSFTYSKRIKSKLRPLEVFVYVLEVVEEANSWPEHQQRERRWFAPIAAADLVSEPDLKRLLLELDRDAIG